MNEESSILPRCIRIAQILAAAASCILGTPALVAGAPHEAIPGPHVDRAVPSYDFQWATVGDVGNSNWYGFATNNGYGRVNYKYRISRNEVTSAQWVDFLNAVAPLADNPNAFARPDIWGGVALGGGQYALNPNLPDAAMRPVYGITWREAAMYCNWLHNGKVASLDAIADGAYDTSSFGGDHIQGYTDQSVRSPGSRFWIPSQSEWMKAAHWDPNRYAEGEGGWWAYSNTSDTAPIAGLPGEGESAAGLEFHPSLFAIPLGAYTDVQSPWGLWDVSGGALEWTERWFPTLVQSNRGLEGSEIGGGGGYPEIADFVGWAGGSQEPDVPFLGSFRVASIVPAPGIPTLGAVMSVLVLRRKRCVMVL